MPLLFSAAFTSVNAHQLVDLERVMSRSTRRKMRLHSRDCSSTKRIAKTRGVEEFRVSEWLARLGSVHHP